MGFSPAVLGGILDMRRDARCSVDEPVLESVRRAGVLARAGVGRGDRVAIRHGGMPDFLADLLAAWRLGACAACLNPSLSPDEVEAVVGFTRPAAVLVATAGHADTSPVPSLCLAEAATGREVAGVVRRDGVDPDTTDLRRWCLERIRREAAPETWYVLSRLPRGDRGKVNHDRVRDRCLAVGRRQDERGCAPWDWTGSGPSPSTSSAPSSTGGAA